MDGTKYKITGNTYPIRKEIKQMGGRWDPTDKAWYLTVGGNGWTGTMWSWRRGGCKVEEV